MRISHRMDTAMYKPFLLERSLYTLWQWSKVIWAKFKSFFSHIANKHRNLDDPLFNKCAHAHVPMNQISHNVNG
jgi:hypothetical protein